MEGNNGKKPVKARQAFKDGADALVSFLRRTRKEEPLRLPCTITPQLAKPIALLTRERT